MSEKLKVYIAAPWAEKEYAATVQDRLEAEGFEVVSRWIKKHLDKPASQAGLEYPVELLRREAFEDVKDVYGCDVLVLLNLQKRGEESTGKAVEFGMALAWERGIIVVGEATNVFHYLGHPRVDTLDEAIALLKQVDAGDAVDGVSELEAE